MTYRADTGQFLLILGRRHCNIKQKEILDDNLEVSFLVCSDGESALPALLPALERNARLDDIPDLVARRNRGDLHVAALDYVGINSIPAPLFVGRHRILPYESMCGCPFSCKYCSYPSASPKWRSRSAEQIARDWSRYADVNGTELVRAMDSTFPVPH